MNRGGGSSYRSCSGGHKSRRNRHMTNASPQSFHGYSNPGPKSDHETSCSEGFSHNRTASNANLGQSHSKERQLGENDVHIDKVVVKDSVDGSTLHLDLSLKINLSSFKNTCRPSVKFEPSREQYANSFGSLVVSGCSDNPVAFEPFDICLPKTGVPMLKLSLLDMKRQKRNDAKRAVEEQAIILEQGMVLLKGYLSVEDQVRIVKKCQSTGLGLGGFYQPGYRNGAKLNLKMMCLGKNWDPNTSQYGEFRPDDGAKPPHIPLEFCKLVNGALKYSRALVESSPECSVEDSIHGCHQIFALSISTHQAVALASIRIKMKVKRV